MSEPLLGGIDVYNMLAKEDLRRKAMTEGASKVELESSDDPLDYAFLKLAASQYYLDRAVECLRNAEKCLTKLAYAMKDAGDEGERKSAKDILSHIVHLQDRRIEAERAHDATQWIDHWIDALKWALGEENDDE